MNYLARYFPQELAETRNWNWILYLYLPGDQKHNSSRIHNVAPHLLYVEISNYLLTPYQFNKQHNIWCFTATSWTIQYLCYIWVIIVISAVGECDTAKCETFTNKNNIIYCPCGSWTPLYIDLIYTLYCFFYLRCRLRCETTTTPHSVLKPFKRTGNKAAAVPP